jgi:DNA polymerase elongation subunit (family B)
LEWDHFHSEDDNGKQKFSIRLFGRTRDNESIYIQADNFKPCFYVKVDSRLRNNHISKIIDDIKKRVFPKQNVDELKKYELVSKCDFYGFTNNKNFNFIKLTFDNYDVMRSYVWAFETTKLFIPCISKKMGKLKLYESNILPLLRCMHTQQLGAVGWASINKNNLQDLGKVTCCKNNFATDYKNITPLNDKSIQKFIIAGLDIECTSEDGTFPQPDRDTDKVIQIGITYSRFGEEECFHKHILCLNETENLDGITVEWFKTEEELLCALPKHLREYDPDIIVGYNTFGFDFEYLYERSKKLGINLKFSRLSRVNNENSEFIRHPLASSALGDNLLKYFKMTGRILIDLYKVVQREYKLSSYKLDSVASNFIRDVVIDITNQEKTFIIKTKNSYGLNLGQYVSITYLDNNIEFKYLDGKKFKIIDFKKDTITCEGNINVKELTDKHYKIFWCQNKDDVSPNDIFSMFKKTPHDRAIVAKYCVQDCVLCNKLMNKLQVIPNNVGMANVCNVPLSFIFLRGQGIKIFSLVSKFCMERGFLIPTIKHKKKLTDEQKLEEQKKLDKQIENFERTLYRREDNKKNENEDEDEDDDETKYEGAIVFPPKSGVHFEPVIVLDFASLYPNSMIFRNLSHETLVMDENYDKLPGYRYNEILYKNEDGSITTCRFAEKLDGTKGIIPQILMNLLVARKATRKLMESEKDPFMVKILDSLQLAYKITANSLYGQTGASTSSIYLKKIAASTTATGREMLKFSKFFVENVFTNLVNLALDDKDKFYEEINKYYMFYPDEVDIGDEKIHIHTDKKLLIDNKKFSRNEIGYDLDFKINNPILDNKTKFYEDFKNYFDEKLWSDFVNDLLNMNIFMRDEFVNGFVELLLSTKPKKNTFYKNHVNKFEKLSLDKEKYICWFEKIFNLENKKDFCVKFIEFVNNIGFTNKKDFFDKFYVTMNKLLDGFHIKFEVIYGDTDSVFCVPHIKNNKTGEILKDKHSLEIGIILGIWGSICICTKLPSPMAQEYEKVLWPLALISKKRYVGNLYEKNTSKYYQKSMGNVLKRRDNAQIVKIIYGGIINLILNLRDPIGAIKFVRDTLMKIITGKYKMDKFVITKTLNANYKNRLNIVHAVLADRIAERDPGNKPQINDRIPYVYFENPEILKNSKEKVLQGERVETPEYILGHNLKIDYLFYITNQIMKPCIEILDLVVFKPEKIFKDYIIREENRQKCLMPINFYYNDKNLKDSISIEQLANNKISNNIIKKKQSVKKKVKGVPNKLINLNDLFG